MAPRKKKPAAGDTFSIDFSKEEGGGGGVRLPEGDYHVKITKVKKTTSSEKGTPGMQVTYKIVDGKKKGREFTDTLWITPKSLWRVRSLLESLGVSVPKKAVNIPGGKLIGKELAVTLTDDEYEGRIRSRVSDFVDLDTFQEDDAGDDDEDAEDDDDTDEDDDDDEEDEDEDEDDVDDDDMEELDLDEF